MLTKEIITDKVEFVGKWKTILVRKRTDILEDGFVVSSSHERDSYELLHVSSISELPEEIQPYATGVWTKALRDELQAEIDAHAQKTAELEAETSSSES